MNKNDKITDIEFSFRCQRQWKDLQKTENSDVRFCNECSQDVHFVGNKLDLAKYDDKAKCFAVKIYDKDLSKAVTMAGGIERLTISNFAPTENIILKFGAKADLSESQIETIKWLHHFNAKPIMKDKMVKLILNNTTKENCERVISMLEKEGIAFIVE